MLLGCAYFIGESGLGSVSLYGCCNAPSHGWKVLCLYRPASARCLCWPLHMVLFGCNKQTGVPNGLEWLPFYICCSNSCTTCLCTPTNQTGHGIPSLALLSKHLSAGESQPRWAAVVQEPDHHTLSPSESHSIGLPVQAENPKPEDVECLCKLLATIGQLLDASQKGHQVSQTRCPAYQASHGKPGVLLTAHLYTPGCSEYYGLWGRSWTRTSCAWNTSPVGPA